MTFRTTLLFAVITFIFSTSCSGLSQSPINPQLSEPQGQIDRSNDSVNNHSLLGYFVITIDREKLTGEIVPVRTSAGHFNIIQFLEQAPCTNCFKLTGIVPNPDGTFDIGISISHPFPIPNLTGFDIRGIAMFNGSHNFPDS